MQRKVSIPRLIGAMSASAVAAAFTFALVLYLEAMSASGSPPKDESLTQIFGMAVVFCFFTFPVATLLAAPANWLWQRFGPMHFLTCAAIGGVIGFGALYIPLLLTGSLHWKPSATLWFCISGIAAGIAFGAIMRRGELRNESLVAR
jgi:hypothetical protein